MSVGSISEDTGEETLLQVSFSKLFLFFSLFLEVMDFGCHTDFFAFILGGYTSFIAGLHAAVAVLAALLAR